MAFRLTLLVEISLYRSSFKAAKSLTFEEESQRTTITILNEKSKEDTGISLQVPVYFIVWTQTSYWTQTS